MFGTKIPFFFNQFFLKTSSMLQVVTGFVTGRLQVGIGCYRDGVNKCNFSRPSKSTA